MKIGVLNEISAVEKNSDIVSSLETFQYEVINVGMKSPNDKPELTYIETGMLSAFLLNLGIIDMVVGGCGYPQHR